MNKSIIAKALGVVLLFKGAITLSGNFWDIWTRFPHTKDEIGAYQIICLILVFSLLEIIFGIGFLLSNDAIIRCSPWFAIVGVIGNSWGLYQVSKIDFYQVPQIIFGYFLVIIFFYLSLVAFSFQQFKNIKNT